MNKSLFIQIPYHLNSCARQSNWIQSRFFRMEMCISAGEKSRLMECPTLQNPSSINQVMKYPAPFTKTHLSILENSRTKTQLTIQYPPIIPVITTFLNLIDFTILLYSRDNSPNVADKWNFNSSPFQIGEQKPNPNIL